MKNGGENAPPEAGAMERSPMWQLFMMRVRSLLREPSALFWTFVFPLLTSVALGIAFRNRTLDELAVAVADGPDAAAVAARLDAADGLRAEVAALAEARDRLRRGRVALVVVPGADPAHPELILDPTQADGRTARLMALDALERAAGREDRLASRTAEVTEPGSRYIDFLIPGLLGMNLMMGGVWGLGWAIVQMRTGKLLKRLGATPMRRSHFLLSFMLSRNVLAIGEIAFFLLYARLLFGVRVFGSVAGLVAFGLYGALCFSGLSLLVSCRAQNSETASGLMNLITMPMMVLSGVFFPASFFPEWMLPVLKALPLTALNDGMRAIMVDGSSIFSLGPQLLVLAAWGAVPFAVALRIFRWV
jgi:ABC-2 type transport system permease protein